MKELQPPHPQFGRRLNLPHPFPPLARKRGVHTMEWYKDAYEAWPHFLENSEGMFYRTYIQDNMHGRQTGEKIILNLGTYDWTDIDTIKHDQMLTMDFQLTL